MREQCKTCAGFFQRDEKAIELGGDKYCEACFEELEGSILGVEELDMVVESLFNDKLSLRDFVQHALDDEKRVKELEEEVNEWVTGRVMSVKHSIGLKELEEQNKRYRELLEQAFRADDLEDIWNIEDEYRALESESDE